MKIGNFETNRIYNVDAYEAIKKLPDNSIDLIVTDAPYDLEVTHGSGAWGVEKKMNYKEIQAFSHGFNFGILDEFCRVLKQINLYIWCSKRQLPFLLNYFVTSRKCLYQIIAWHKTNAVPAVNNIYMPDTEYCLFFRERRVPLYGNAKSKGTFYLSPCNVADKKKFGHPTIKPLNIIANLITNSSTENAIVLDPFGGSGTTAVACKNTNRNFIVFEINKEYYDSAVNRLNNVQVGGQMTLFTM